MSGRGGMGCILFNWVANSRSAFLVGFPAAKEGTVADGGAARMVMILEAAC